uniref:Uncharacterized protein n=1 Tax=Candidatus Kentrum sp. TC TaxID=2126339 RepID=A0A450ZF15_9GAMM|nr:MAG: protein of unknown function (DUF4407) [Candidatus Kentron sp. TC]
MFLFVEPVTNNVKFPLIEQVIGNFDVIATIPSFFAFPLWLFFILHANRALMSSIIPGGNIWNLLRKTWPRIILSALVSFAVAHPLMLFLFSEDIEENYKSQRFEKIKAEKDGSTIPSRNPDLQHEKSTEQRKSEENQPKEGEQTQNGDTLSDDTGFVLGSKKYELKLLENQLREILGSRKMYKEENKRIEENISELKKELDKEKCDLECQIHGKFVHKEKEKGCGECSADNTQEGEI